MYQLIIHHDRGVKGEKFNNPSALNKTLADFFPGVLGQ